MFPRPNKIEIDVPLLDFRRLHMVAKTEQEKTAFLELFFETADAVLSEMERAHDYHTMPEWLEAAHKLRGAAGNIGMATLEKLCIESGRIDWTVPDARKIQLKKIRSEIADIKSFIARNHSFLLAPEK